VLDSFLEGREALDWAKRATQLTVELDQAEEKARIGELAYELGELYMRQLEDEASAVKAYGRALQADPSLRANLWAIRKIFYRRELWPNLVKLVGAELRFASNQDQRVDLLTERGRILLHHVKDLPAAQESYEQALALNPADIQSLLALERIARTGDNKGLLWRALEGLARTVANPDRKAALLIELAREYRLAKDKFDEAKQLLSEATELGVLHDALAREREALAVAMEDGSAFAASLERRVAAIAESFGDAGIPSPAEIEEVAGAQSKVRKMVALRRHQAHLWIFQDLPAPQCMP
jgi:tetratricopeptide (TPR) repeat protein